jgi:RHS repeat-associated protein
MDAAFAPRTSSAADWNFLFHAEFLDNDSGLYNYGYRYYNLQLGRWPSRDPIGEEGGVNLYGFVRNDGVNGTDFLGLAPPLKPIPDYEYDPNAPRDSSDNDSKEEDCFCCCVDDLTINADPVRPGDKDNPHKAFGHIVKVGYKTSWVKTTKDKEGVCSLTWREKISRVPTHLFDAGARKNKWYDATALLPDNPLFKPFHENNKKRGPGGTLLDPAVIRENSASRTLEFEITITSTPDCGCDHPSKTVTGIQTLDPGSNSLNFKTPNKNEQDK